MKRYTLLHTTETLTDPPLIRVFVENTYIGEVTLHGFGWVPERYWDSGRAWQPEDAFGTSAEAIRVLLYFEQGLRWAQKKALTIV